MTLRPGKLDRRAMERMVYGSLGRRSPKVVLGPGTGRDNAVVAVGGDIRMLVTTDPVSMIPSIGAEESAWLSVHLIASDYTTSGRRPEFATFAYNLPLEISEEEERRFLWAIGRECRDLKVSIVGGHTGSYPGGGFTVIGSGTMFGFCRRGDYVDSTMARAGDVVLMTKGAAIEATAVLSNSFPKHVERAAGRAVLRRARGMLRDCSTVKDAAAAACVGLGREGITSMHDATEGGVLGGLAEMAEASRKAFIVEREKIPVSAEASAVCLSFAIDPLSAVSEGTLLLTCAPGKADNTTSVMRRRGVAAFEIGRVARGRGLWASTKGGRLGRVAQAADSYWRAYSNGILSHLK